MEISVDLVTGKLLDAPDKILEISGVDALTLDQESWKNVKEQLVYPAKVVLFRTPMPRVNSSSMLKYVDHIHCDIFLQNVDRNDIDDMQKRLERKLMDARKAHSELRVVIRENQHLEQENTRYNKLFCLFKISQFLIFNKFQSPKLSSSVDSKAIFVYLD